MFKRVIRPIFFLFPAETIRRFSICMLRFAGGTRLGRWMLRRIYCYDSPNLEREVFGITFSNPIGLAAGYDTDARLYRELGSVGFGFVEAGTITAKPQPGNLKPRLSRLVKDRALVNRMGHPSGGLERALSNLRSRERRGKIAVGANIACNTLSRGGAINDDYLKLFRNLYQYVNYFVVNINMDGVLSGEFHSRVRIEEVLEGLFEFRRGQNQYRPVLIKISPDWPTEFIDEIIGILIDTQLDGLVVAGTTLSREGLSSSEKEIGKAGSGGLSGPPLLDRTIDLVGYVGRKMDWQYPIIASGGVTTPEDAERVLAAGASLVEIYTSLVYSGPGLLKKILRHLDGVLSGANQTSGANKNSDSDQQSEQSTPGN